MNVMKIVEYMLTAQLNKNYKIALLSDLHSIINPKIIPTIRNIKPSFICIAGDLCNTSLKESNTVKRFLENCISLAPTFFSLGNHDFQMTKEDIKWMKSIGIAVLNDEFTHFGELVIGGLTSSFYHKCEKYDPKISMPLYPEVKWLDVFEKQDGYKILLDHHPENYEPYTSYRNINLILSGHAHGGQIRVFGKGIYGRSQGFLPKYDGGLFDNKLIVGRGLSNTLSIPRLGNPTEIVIVEIKGVEK